MSRTILIMCFAIAALPGCALLAPHRMGELAVTYWDQRTGDTEEEHYDTKCMITIDGKPAGESDVADRYEKKRMTVALSQGTHSILIEGFARKGGAWEKITTQGGYPVNHRLEKQVIIHPGLSTAVNFVTPDRTAGGIRMEIHPGAQRGAPIPTP